MVERSAIAWVAENKLIAAGVACIVIAAAVTYALVTGSEKIETIAHEGRQAETTSAPQGHAGTTKTKSKTAPGVVTVPGGTSSADVKAVIPGFKQQAAKPCSARKVDEVGVTDDEITIAQVVTDSNQIPQQLRPAHEGLEAFVKLYNSSGGLCGRKLVLQYRNDQLNPAIHTQDMRDLAGTSLAFVANESLFDQLDYDQNPPFDSNIQGGGSTVPDVGGLAFAYPRSQSRWHAGVIGSVSPVLVGGGQYRYFQSEMKAKGTPCRKAGVVYLQEPTGASQDQAEVGAVSLEESWGAGLGHGNTKLYGAGLFDSEVQYEGLVGRMQGDGMNCAFGYTDLQSSINLALAMRNRGVWPPSQCKLGNGCFRVFYIPLSAYDPKFIKDAHDAALGVSTFIPHLPIDEKGNSALRVYLDALGRVSGATPSTFSIVGFTSGLMLVQALQSCPAAPTRKCLMDALHGMKDFSASGLLGGITPFRTTRVTYDRYGTFDWKWIFSSSVAMRVMDRSGKRDFYRIRPEAGFFHDVLHVARGTPG